MTKRDRRGRLTREITYQRVLLAVYMLSDAEGLACDAPVARIGLECGHGVVAVQRSIATMIDRGVVLADHPRAGAYIAEVKARVKAATREVTDRRVARKQGRAS